MPLYQPVRYNVPENKIDTNLLLQGLQGLDQQKQQNQFQQSLGGMVDSGNVDYQQLMTQFPEQQKFLMNMEKQQSFRNQLQGTNASRDAVNLYRALDRGDTEGAKNLLLQNADSINSMGDPSFTADKALQLLEQDPEQLKNAAVNIARMGGGQDAFLEQLSAGQPQPMTEYQQAMISQKGVDQELRRLELEDKKLDRQYDRAKDDLERVKIQQQIDTLNAKKTEALEVKEKKKTEAVTTTQQTLESVNELLNAPGLDSAVGGTSAFYTIPGGESADFETALDSFIGNLTLENMGKMSGVLSDSDIKMIQNASSGLSIKMSETAFKKRLQKIKSRLEEKLSKQGGGTTTVAPSGNITDGNFNSLWGD